MTKKKLTRAEQELQARMIERFADGQWHTIEEMARELAHTVPKADALAAYHTALREGHRCGRRWARKHGSPELIARLRALGHHTDLDWVHWLEAADGARGPGEVLHALLVPGAAGPASARSFWRGQRVDEVDSCCPLFLAGFAEGVLSAGERPRGLKPGRRRKGQRPDRS